MLNTFVDATKIDERDDMGQWCNQANQGIGALPTVNPGFFANLNAYVWVKPPGESDGNYPGSVYNGVTSTAGDPELQSNQYQRAGEWHGDQLDSRLASGGHFLAHRVC